jgi:hypothetical protein
MNSDTVDNAVNGKNVINVLGYAWESQATPRSIPPKAAKQLVAFVFGAHAAPSVPTL